MIKLPIYPNKKGNRGFPGIQGIQGIRGIRGEKGDSGEKGDGTGVIVKTQTGQLTDSVYQTIPFPAEVTRDTVISYFIAIERTDAQNVNYWATPHNNHDGRTFTAYLTLDGLKFNIVSNIHAKQYKIVYLILA